MNHFWGGFEKEAATRWSKEFWKKLELTPKMPFGGAAQKGIPLKTTIQHVMEKQKYLPHKKEDHAWDIAMRRAKAVHQSLTKSHGNSHRIHHVEEIAKKEHDRIKSGRTMTSWFQTQSKKQAEDKNSGYWKMRAESDRKEKDQHAEASKHNDGHEVVMFHADWAGPSRLHHPLLQKAVDEYPGLKMRVVDVDKDQDEPIKHKIKGIPHVQLRKGDQVIDQYVGHGSNSENNVHAFLSKHLKRH